MVNEPWGGGMGGIMFTLDTTHPEVLAHLTHVGRGLRAAGYDFVEVPLAHQVRTKVVGALSGEGTVPQVFINGQRIGGADAVKAWLAKRA